MYHNVIHDGPVSDRQGRWLHARISADLEQALKREARRRRSPVSLVVRNVLEGALDLVEGIVEDSLDVARRSQRLARRVSRAGATLGNSGGERAGEESIYGWQELILNRAAECSRCDAELTAGKAAYRGLSERAGGPLVFLCPACVRRLHRAEEDR